MKTFKEHNVTAPTPVEDGAGGYHIHNSNITGTGLIISGIVDNENNSTNQKTISGLTILVTTFLH